MTMPSIKSNKELRVWKRFAEFFQNNIKRKFSGLSTARENSILEKFTMLAQAGISFEETLLIIGTSESHPKFIHGFKSISDMTSQGISISQSFEKSDIGFSSDTIGYLYIGERTGTLTESFRNAAINLNKKGERLSAITQALMYPMFIVLATVLIVVFLVFYIFPKITPVFSSMNAKLPLLTRVVLGVSTSVIELWWLWIIVAFVALVVLLMIFNNSRSRLFVLKMLLKTPLIKTLISAYCCASLFRSLGNMLGQGIILTEALALSQRSMVNMVYQQALEDIVKNITLGMSLSISLKKYTELFPDMSRGLIKIGERTGSLPHTFLTLAHVYDKELESILKRLTSMLEPVLMILMGGIIGALALSMILPIYSLTSSFKQ